MSTVPSEATSATDIPCVNLNIPDYPGVETIILRSKDSHYLQVPKIFIIHNSPVLDELVRRTLDSSGDSNGEASLPVTLRLPERGKILRHLLTFILPVYPAMPPTHEETMELLSVAQKYQMETVLVHIRKTMALENPLSTQLEPALRIYSLAQRYGLLPEALQAARAILRQWMAIEDFDNKLDIIPGAYLYELWRYYERVRTTLASDLTEFRESGAHGTLTGIKYLQPSLSQIPMWLDRYIESIAKAPKLFDMSELNIAMAHHHMDNTDWYDTLISSQTIRDFWEALTSVVDDSFKKAESALSVVQEREDAHSRINPTKSPLEPSHTSDANLIIRSSDFVDFKVHKAVLAVASPFFKDLLSLPQPPDGESVDGLPVVQLSEDSELLSTLISMLYPLRPVVPSSFEKVLYLLAACQKYEMDSVQLSIRAEVSHGIFPAPKGVEAFSAYAIASSKGLVPEMENAARQTLDQPMTFEIIGERLRLFEGWALRDLANFRKRYRNNLVSRLKSFLETSKESQFNIGTCRSVTHKSYVQRDYPSLGLSLSRSPMSNTNESLPPWLEELYQKHLYRCREAFSKHLLNPRSIREEYLSALQAHIKSYGCVSCTKVHAKNGEAFCKYLEDGLMQVLYEALR